jgi:hypothetical protein
MKIITVTDKDNIQIDVTVQHIVAVSDATNWGSIKYKEANASIGLANGGTIFTKETRKEIRHKIVGGPD